LINLHGERFNDEQFRRSFAQTIIDNLLDGTIALLGSIEDPKYDSILKQVKDAQLSRPTMITPDLAEALKDLFTNDESFREARVEQKNAVNLQDCWEVFAEEFVTSYPAWAGQDWIPSTEDCIRSRTRTSGVVQENVTVDRIPYCIIDVGGQRAERRKWMHMFENVTAAIFVTSLSEYDQGLFEDPNKNRLEEALDLFQTCVQTQWLAKSILILFLNKKDLFDQKFLIEKIPINISGKFPDAPTDHSSAAGALEWFTCKFESKKTQNKRSPLYVHVTTATDSKHVKKVFDTCKRVIADRALTEAGILF